MDIQQLSDTLWDKLGITLTGAIVGALVLLIKKAANSPKAFKEVSEEFKKTSEKYRTIMDSNISGFKEEVNEIKTDIKGLREHQKANTNAVEEIKVLNQKTQDMVWDLFKKKK